MRYLYTFLLLAVADMCCLHLQAQEKMLILTPACFSRCADSLKENKNDVICAKLVCSSSESLTIKQSVDSMLGYFDADYLLILGDYEFIPSHRIQDGLSDIYYTCDSNGFTSVPVGRFPIQTETEFYALLRKNTAHTLAKAITIASAEKSTLTDKCDWERLREISMLLEQKHIPTTGEYFDGSQNGLDAEGNPDADDIVTAVNQGADLLLYAGHGDYTGWNTGMLTNTHLRNLYNTRYPIIMAAACNNGHFAGRTCMAEAWLNQEYGAKAVIMSSSLCDWDANLEALAYMGKHLPGQTTLGKLWLTMYQYACDSLHRNVEAQTWMLFGDPSLCIALPAGNNIHPTKNHTLLLYPNPAQNHIHLHCDDIPAAIFVYNSAGTLIQHITPDNNHTDIDISSWPSGYYIIQTENTSAFFCKQ